MSCNCGKKKTNGLVALAAFPVSMSEEDMDEVFKTQPINLKQSVLDANNGKKKYFIRASDARKYNGGDRYLVISSTKQHVAEPIIDWLRGNPYHKNDFEASPVVAETIEPVVEGQMVEEPAAEEPVVEGQTVEEPVVEVSLDTDTLYIAAYEADVLYDHLDPDDFSEMTLEELTAYVNHYQIDIGRATSEAGIREKVIDWWSHNDANNG